MRKVAYLISHGHTARGAVQTDLLKKLVDSGIGVEVIVKSGSEKGFMDLVKSQGAQISTYNTSASRWQYHLSQVRTYIHQNIRKNPALWEKHQRKLDPGITSGRKRLLTKTYTALGNGVRKIPLLKKIFTGMEKRSYDNTKAINLLKTLNPDIVISTRPVDPMEIEFLRAAEKLKMRRLMYILSWDNITTKGFFPVLAEDYLTWGEIMNQELKEFYDTADENIFSTGVTHFDVHAMIRSGEIEEPKNLLGRMGLSDDRPFLFFTMSSSYYAPNEIDIIEALAKSVEGNQFGEEMQLVIRPHMINLMADRSDQAWLKRLESLVSQRVKVDFPDSENSLLTWYMKQDDMIKLSALLNRASVCLNSGSTIAIEAVYLDRPVVLTPFDTEEWPYWQSARRLMDYVHLQKFAATGASVIASDLDHMMKSIKDYLKNPDLHSENRKRAVEQECFKNDGKATERFVKNVHKIFVNAGL